MMPYNLHRVIDERNLQDFCAIMQNAKDLRSLVNQRNRKHKSPLYLAIATSQFFMAQMLIANGARIQTEDEEGMSLIDVTHQGWDFETTERRKERFQCLQLLFDSGLRYHKRNFLHGYETLRNLARRGVVDMTRYLLQKGARPNAPIEGYYLTPLHTALVYGHATVAISLLQGGASTADSPGDKYGCYNDIMKTFCIRQKWPGLRPLIYHLVKDRSLQNQARLTIRERIAETQPWANLNHKLQQLELPKSMVDYLMFKYDFEHVVPDPPYHLMESIDPREVRYNLELLQQDLRERKAKQKDFSKEEAAQLEDVNQQLEPYREENEIYLPYFKLQ